MSNKMYDALKYIALIGLPAITTLVITLGHLWGLENVDTIGATIAAITACLGALLQINTAKYNALKEGKYV